MPNVQKRKGRAVSMPAGLGTGTAVSVGLTVLLAGILAQLVLSQILPEAYIGYGVMVLLLGSSLAGAAVAAGKIKRQRILVCIFSGALYLLVLLGITALFFGGQYEAVGTTALLVMGGALTAGILGMNERRPQKGRKLRRRIC